MLITQIFSYWLCHIFFLYPASKKVELTTQAKVQSRNIFSFKFLLLITLLYFSDNHFFFLFQMKQKAASKKPNFAVKDTGKTLKQVCAHPQIS